jgi:transposase InsO family protein
VIRLFEIAILCVAGKVGEQLVWSGERSLGTDDTVSPALALQEARAGIGRYLLFYNAKRPHSSLDRQTPGQADFNALQSIPVAA